MLASVHVRRPADVAFRVFTERIGDWWPLHQKSISVQDDGTGAPETVIMEGSVGGRLYERTGKWIAASLRDHWDDAMLYRDLARLRTADDGVSIRQRTPDELRWDGAPRAEWDAFCEEWGLERLRTRPHRWTAEG